MIKKMPIFKTFRSFHNRRVSHENLTALVEQFSEIAGFRATVTYYCRF